ncbi:MAG: T9SS type A sorting domain-containing protein [Prolixibacteraceae bacterium]|nr:T9SS type A sorting domain-containing protein [Prolixibacteraceae bacterium]
MKKILLSLIVSLLITFGASAQSINDSFFDHVNYIGAFDGTFNWTAGWAEWSPVDKVYADATLTKGNGQFAYATGTHITADETWTGVIKLNGWVYVDEGATLTIQAGTIIRGTEKSAVIVQRGGKINAVGTSTNPIVFTSNLPAGLRTTSSWGGLVLCGKATNNISGGVGTAEGGITSQYGGTDDNDNSGTLKYVRIEFAGYEIATGSEINGLTLCSVGRATTIDHIQVSYSGDDAYEWFGGTVNAKYLISYKTEDDDFDTDNGFRGMVQYGVVLRTNDIVDTDAANTFESDNDAAGSTAEPFTHAVFSNISAFGPAITATNPATLQAKHADGSGFRIRRNSRLQIYNTAILGWGKGVRIESDGTQTAAQSDLMTIQNCIIAGIRGDNFIQDANATVMTAATMETWFKAATRKNQVLAANADVKITDPFNFASPNFQPATGSPVLNASYWYAGTTNNTEASIDNSFFDHVNYIGAFDGSYNWTTGWTEWDPVNKAYADATTTKGNGQFAMATGTHITANETWSGVIKLDGWVYVDAGATLTINAGTVIRGTEKSALIVQRGGKINAVGTSTNPIVFTSNQAAGLRTTSNWGGVVLCGNATNNISGGVGTAEGGITSQYGGTDDNDNSGKLQYVRIEFAGYEIATGSEINGLTLCSVGRATTIDHIQVSYSGDDAYEWFGGTVNAKYLISYKTEDDDFDTDNGFRGMVQYGVALRINDIVDTDAANTFESDNDAAGSTALPFTHAVFSNISAFGPAITATNPASLQAKHADGSGFRIRRNSRLQIYNTAILGWGKGLRIESDGTQTAANSDLMTIQNCIMAGIRGDNFIQDANATVMTAATMEAWYKAATRKNQLFTANADVKITDPFNFTSPNFQPATGSPVLNASYWYSGTTNTTEASINNSFFDHVKYVGAFDGTTNWTTGWAEWDPVNKVYADATTTKGNGQFAMATGTHITANETWSGTVKLDGWVYVDAGATLTISAGTVIRGTEKSALIVQRGGKINAVGTSTNPIVFTSNQAAGLRTTSNWGGVVLCGNAKNNIAGGVGTAEGGITSQYGGTDDSDNSGTLQYVRIEFAGYEISTGSEINGLTLCSVGNGTTLDHIQVSYSGDDAYEWFGGSVNAKYLISYKTEDDDFDTDNGFRGMIQYAVALRTNDIVDTDAANAFESDNDAAGSTAEPFTHAVFSNVSAFGPAITATNPATLQAKHADGSAMRLRRNTRLQIYNTAFLGWGKGLRLESDGSQTAANTDLLTVQNCIMAGIRGDNFIQDANATVMTAATMEAWYKATKRTNQLFTNNTDVKIADPFNFASPNFQPATDSPVQNASYWVITAVEPTIANEANLVSYPNPFSGSTNIELQLEKSSYVRIVVTDISGRTVANLQEGNLTEGTHRFEFDGSALPKGMYIAKVITSDSQKSVKMISK